MSSVSVNSPRTPVTTGSMGLAAATLPNVCKMPGPPAPFVPVPLPNIGKSDDSPKDYSKEVTIEGHDVAVKGATFGSMGDAASKGTGGGVVSNNTHGPTSFVGPGSMDVKIEGKNVQLLGDPMLNNNGPSGSPANAATLLGLVQAPGLVAVVGDEPCPLCGKQHGEAAQLKETPDTKSKSDDLKKAADEAVKAARKRRDKLQKEYDDAAAAKNHKAEVAYQQQTERLEKQLAAVQARGLPIAATVAENLARHRAAAPDRVQAEVVGSPEIATMLTVALCADHTGDVFAAKSSEQVAELVKEVPAAWHMPHTTRTILKEGGGCTETAAERRARFKRHVGAKFGNSFDKRWQRAQSKSNDFPKTSGRPAYPPGTCGGPQAVLLALDHGARPVGLTERWYDSANAAAKTPVRYRDRANDRVGKIGSFGGTDAVPPCEACQILLPMLICPEDNSMQCEHKPPGAKETCKCQNPSTK